MSRISTSILVILILLNGSVGIMEASGLTEDIGVELDTGVGDSMDKAINHATNGFNPGDGAGSTLFGLFVSAFYFLNTLFNAIFSAPAMFMNLGFPSWFVVPIFAPMYVIATLDLIYAATGRDMT